MGLLTSTIERLNRKHNGRPRSLNSFGEVGIGSCGIPGEELFHGMVRLERKRTERSGSPFLLMLVNIDQLSEEGEKSETPHKIVSAVSASTRETDIIGWHMNNCTIGVIFTEIGARDRGFVKAAILNNLYRNLQRNFAPEAIDRIHIVFHVFPKDDDEEGPSGESNAALYPDITRQRDVGRPSLLIKRLMDVGGSIVGLVMLAPVFIVVAILVKISSRGPILIRQRRIGRLGSSFTFLKFRSMYVNSDHEIHQQYVKKLIAGGGDGDIGGSGKTADTVYKIKDDPRITPIGRFLRRSSLDELPQLWNVVRGEMSLVGPRPPIPYEFESYDVWHRTRLLEVKPGITGLWQVKGRSRTTFDEMVRLDLRYIRKWSLWLDVTILLQTPWAVLSGRGAY